MKQDRKGLIFDIDGVVLDTPHEAAWAKALFELQGVTGFTSEIYQETVSGYNASDAARNLLSAFGLSAVDSTIDDLVALKQSNIEEAISTGKYQAYDSAVSFMLAAKYDGNKIAALSTSQSADAMLKAIKVADCVDGHTLHAAYYRDHRLYDLFNFTIFGTREPGKPSQFIFQKAAEGVMMDPEQSIVFEASAEGVQSAKKAGFYCVGLSRRDNVTDLCDAGANVVVADLRELPYQRLKDLANR